MAVASARAARRALSLRQLALLRPAAGGLHACMADGGAAAAAAATAAAGPPPVAPASPLWRYDSPLLRHLSSLAEPEASGPTLPPYEQLKYRAAAAVKLGGASGVAQPLVTLSAGQRTHFNGLLRKFQLSGAVKDQALALYVNSKLYAEAMPQFQEWLLAGMDGQLRDALMSMQVGQAAQEALFPYFAQFVLERYMEDIKAYREMVQTVDLRKPHQWFPVARALQRRIIYHAGPTNSGKTYNALQAMRGAQSGVYCGPLRLLAMEVYDTCNADGLYCNLITGQERREVPGAEHTACTVEMVNMQRRIDVAVIDEIQMIGDETRGWAWTRALMGVPANEVHLCGDGSAVPLVRRICEDMGESFTLNEYDRFTKLTVEEGGLEGGYGAVQPGDCIVAFSRKDIYSIKQYIEQETKHRACVVYGALPPETRRQQAKLFNEEDNAYRVMVASDAVGMGLNLNIRRVIFHAVTKREGAKAAVPVSVSMLKQIAGRAGRRSSQWPEGLATCRDPADVARLQEAIAVPLDQLTTPTAGLFPEFEHFEVFAGQRPDEPYSSLLQSFEREALLDSNYFFCRQESVVAAAAMLGELGLSVKDMFNFCMAPASAYDLRLSAALLQFATKYSKGQPVTLDISVPDRVPASTEELRHMEAAHQVVMLWLWLSYRFDAEVFPQRDKVQALADRICLLLDKGLRRLTRMSKSGIDIAELPSRPEHESILECFGDELELLESQRRQQRLSEARSKRQGRRRTVATELAAALAAAGGLDGEADMAGEARQEVASEQGTINAQRRREAQREARQRRKNRLAEQQAAGGAGEDRAAGKELQRQQEKAVAPGQHRHQRRQAEKQAERERQRQEKEEQAQWARVGGAGLPGKRRTPEQQAVHAERLRAQRERRAELKRMRLEERQREAMAYVLGEAEAAAATNAAHAAHHPTKAHLHHQRPVVAEESQFVGQQQQHAGQGSGGSSQGSGSGEASGSASSLRSGWNRLMSLFK
ncbi:ATP-dependent RNA helicase mitochondrial [Chlorella sorokiniana]|uniref:RNA helicase n=1 Tax=Chlorella sorokiniana TaxID=3076 RepID=A0A2P6TQ59_CHLSO|nr:ATP-dependent RNA helicase mitochondrial [Chlorella sorokiniana]|eukprot:PRW56167.1 ATP-dependent RNA helicase mitochondrial [Chlorella sorokiniana]